MHIKIQVNTYLSCSPAGGPFHHEPRAAGVFVPGLAQASLGDPDLPKLLRQPTLTLGQSSDSLGSDECTPKRLAFTPPGSLTPMMASPVHPVPDSQLAHQCTGFSEATTTPATLLYSPPHNSHPPAPTASTDGQPSAPATATKPATNAALVHGQPLANMQPAMTPPAHSTPASTPASTHGQPPQMTPPAPATTANAAPSIAPAASTHGQPPAGPQVPQEMPLGGSCATLSHAAGAPASSSSSGGVPDEGSSEVSIRMEGTMYTDGTYWKKPACIKAATCSII